MATTPKKHTEDEVVDILDNPKEEPEDQVSAAYESINKRLESLKGGSRKDEDDDIDEDDELETDDDTLDKPSKKDQEDLEDEIDPLDKEDEEVEDENDDDTDEEDDSSDDIDEDSPKKETFVNDPIESNDDTEDKEKVEDFDDSPKQTFKSNIEDRDTIFEEKLPTPKDEEPDSLDDLAEEKTVDEADLSIPNLRSNSERLGMKENNLSEQPMPRRDRDDFSDSFRYQQRPPRRGSKWHLLILILIGLGVIGGTVYLLKNQFPQATAPSPSPSEVMETSPSPTPSLAPDLDRATFKVRVLNGTPQTGLAATVSDKLKSLGYQGEKVGNATNSAFTKTVIRVKPSATGLADQLIKDLSADYSNATSEGELKDSDAADAEVILGKN